jgi:hypothetical protein
MANLFKKAAVCTDIHFGAKSNSEVHNQDCLNFIDWFIVKAKEENCEMAIFCGDWHNSRASINISTLQYSLRALEKLSAAFDRVFFIPGNHDLYYRDRRDITSVAWAQHIPNIHIVNESIYTEGDVAIVPWLIGDDHKKLGKVNAKYMFGHLELPHFLMNAKVAMPDHGEIKSEDFRGVEHVYSGHFHIRQKQGNITYIGNCFPHNYADAWDDERGMMIQEWGKPPVYHNWPGAPRFRTLKLSELLESPETFMNNRTYLRVTLDKDVSYEEANFVKETFHSQYGCRELALIAEKNLDLTQEYSGDIKFESVDQIVSEQLLKIQSDTFDPALLLDIYRNL